MPAMLKVGFVPSIRDRENVLPWSKQMRDESLAALRSISGWEVVTSEPSPDDITLDPVRGYTPYGVIGNLDDADTMVEFFKREGVDALVICPLNFGDERSASKIAERLRVPTFLYATKEPAAREDASLARISDSYCGNLSIASGLYRRKLPFYWSGLYLPTEPALRAELDTFCRAALVVKGLLQARIGQIGVRPATFETVGYDEHALALKFGQNIIYADLSDIVDASRELCDDDPRVQAIIAETRSSVAAVTVADDYLLKVAKLEVAILEFARVNKLSALSAQCWPSVRRLLSISVCAMYGRLTAQGLPTACEVDILGALAMIAGYAAAKREVPPHFVDWTIQHREDPNLLLAWHCGNAPVCLAADPAKTALRARFNMTGTDPITEGDREAGMNQFELKPGPVTFCRLAEYDNKWKMLIARGEIEPSGETLAGTWAWVRVRDHAALYRTLVEEGFVHHASMSHGDQVAALKMACKFLDITPVVVE